MLLKFIILLTCSNSKYKEDQRYSTEVEVLTFDTADPSSIPGIMYDHLCPVKVIPENKASTNTCGFKTKINKRQNA